MIGELSTWVMFILFGIGSVVTARKIPPEKKVGIAKYLAHMGVGSEPANENETADENR